MKRWDVAGLSSASLLVLLLLLVVVVERRGVDRMSIEIGRFIVGFHR